MPGKRAFLLHLHQRTDGLGRPTDRVVDCRLVFRIAQFSDLHCGETYFEASLLERAIGEINELQPDVVVCSGDLTTLRIPARVPDCARVPRSHRLRRRSSSSRATTTRATSAMSTSRRCSATRNSVLRKGRSTIVAVDSSEPDLDHGQIGRGRYRWIEEQFAADPAELKIFVLHHHLLPVPGPGASGTSSTTPATRSSASSAPGVRSRPLRAQARALRLAARGPLRRQRGNGVVAPPPGQHEALLQRRSRSTGRASTSGGGIRSTARSKLVSVRDSTPSSTRSSPARDRGRGHRAHVRALAIVDGEHYAAGRARRARRAAVRVRRGRARRGHGEAARGEEYGVPLVVDVEAAIARACPGRRRRPLRRAGARPRRALRARQSRARAADCRTSAPTSVSTRRASSRFELPSIAVVGTGKRVGKTAVTGHARAASRCRPSRRRRRDGEGRAARAGGRRRVPPTVDALVELSRSGRHAASDHLETAALVGVADGRLPALRWWPRGRRRDLERARGGARIAVEHRARRSSSSTAAVPRIPADRGRARTVIVVGGHQDPAVVGGIPEHVPAPARRSRRA